ncbi:MAG: diguanylate cyclase, partial [Bacteroidetes bacterium]
MSTQHPFPIVGIGASAGGLKAIEEIMQNLPEDTGMAFIIIQHLSRRFKSLMKEILIKDTRMSIIPVEDGMEVQPNCVYLMPAGINMVMRNRRLFLEDQKETDTPHFVIDTFLHSLGRDAREQSIGVILSGTGSDGSRGIYSIKEMGGVVIVQEPDSGEFDGMPLSSINTRIVDHILPPAEIAEKLVFLSRNPEPESLPEQEAAVPVDEDEEIPVEGSETLALVLDLIQRNHEVDFSFYKIGTISRRIQKHMAVHGLDDMR